MAPVNILKETVGSPGPNTIRVLVTGFGPFWRYTENPSWLAVKPLHNVILNVEPSSESVFVQSSQSLQAQNPHPVNGNAGDMGHDHPDDHDLMTIDDMDQSPPTPLDVHITTLQIPVTYQAVLATVPGLHARPPVLPEAGGCDLVMPPPPENGYDFIFHVGVAGRGHLRMEQLAHKLGYRMKDADGQYAPVVQITKPPPPQEQPLSEAEKLEAERLAQQNIVPITDIGPPPGPANLALAPPPPGVNGDTGDIVPPVVEVEVVERPVVRGHGSKAYEGFPDELSTEIDVASLIHSLKESGHTQVYSSMDAGHYLCDFLFYGSLAEARRVAKEHDTDFLRSTPPRGTPVLFMHCPPDGQPVKTEAVTEAIKFIVAWVCRRSRT